jgi:small subunit ribosomal protein S1
MEKLVGQEITCRIIKLDTAEEDVVVDRRAALEEQAVSAQQDRYAALQPGDIVTGTVRTLMTYGAFVDIGGIDGLLHVSDLSWSRISTPEEVLSVGQELQVKILKIDPETRRISLGLKQLQPEPWETAADRYQAGQRVTGTVRRLMDFGAFVELEPGIEGMIHVSEMSWVKRVRKPGDILKEGDTVEVVILSINPAEKRMALGLKQTLGDPWADVAQRFPVGSAVDGTVTRMASFGAFVQLTEGVEGLVHISEISVDKRLNHPQEALKLRQTVRAQVLALDQEKRQIKLSIKQLVPTGLDEYFSEHKAGDIVSGRIVEVNGSQATVELGEGIRVVCPLPESVAAPAVEGMEAGGADLSALSSMLQSRWKGTAKVAVRAPEAVRTSQVRSFRIASLDEAQKRIELQLA